MAGTSGELRLHGRDAQLATLTQLIGGASERFEAAVIDGEPGIGKTSLLSAGLETASARGLRVFLARTEELEQSRPFGVLAIALGCERRAPDERRAAIARLISGGPDDGASVTQDPSAQFRAVDAFLELLEEEALTEPLLLAIDDLHWADPGSATALHAIARRLRALPILLLLTSRPAPRPKEVELLIASLRGEGATVVTLPPLDEEAVAGIAADVLGAEPGSTLMRDLRGAGGNPLFVTELLRSLEEDHAIEFQGARADATVTSVPPTLRLTILHRLGLLDEAMLDALRTACVLGYSFTLRALSVVTGRPMGELTGIVERALRARVLDDAGERVRFRHALIRDAIYEDVPAPLRAGMHRAHRAGGRGGGAQHIAGGHDNPRRPLPRPVRRRGGVSLSRRAW